MKKGPHHPNLIILWFISSLEFPVRYPGMSNLNDMRHVLETIFVIITLFCKFGSNDVIEACMVCLQISSFFVNLDISPSFNIVKKIWGKFW